MFILNTWILDVYLLSKMMEVDKILVLSNVSKIYKKNIPIDHIYDYYLYLINIILL